jgi:putative transposase
MQIMARIDALYQEVTCSNTLRVVDFLAREGIPISHERVRNFRQHNYLRVIYQKSSTKSPRNPRDFLPAW